MAVPSSGPLSMSTIRSAGISGGCSPYSTGQISLSTLADNFGIGTNPDKISDFYGLNCPSVNNCNTYDIYSNGRFTTVAYTDCCGLSQEIQIYAFGQVCSADTPVVYDGYIGEITLNNCSCSPA